MDNMDKAFEVKLTLDPENDAAAAAAEAPADTTAETPDAAILDESSLSDEERKMVEDFASQIDITNSGMVMQYGAAAQKKVADFSDSALDGVRTKDFGELGDQIADLITELKGIDPDGAADQTDPEQRLHDERKDPIDDRQHDPAVEESDDHISRACSFVSGDGGTARGHRHDERSSEKERESAASGHC